MEENTIALVMPPSEFREAERHQMDKDRLEIDKGKLLVQKLDMLDTLMASVQPKDSAPYSGEEGKWQSSYSEPNLKKIEKKIMELIEKL